MGLGKEEHKSKVSFSSYRMEHTGACCQHELSQLYWPWSCGRGRVCQASQVPPLLYCTLWKEVTVYGPHLSGELCSTSLRMLSLHKLFESVLHGRFFYSPLLLCLFIYVSMDSWLFILYSALQSSTTLFCCSDCFSFGFWVSFRSIHVSLWHTPLAFFVLVCFWALLYFLALQDAPGSSCVFLAPVLDSAVSPRGPFIEE